jgi:hypothetical protein
MKEGLLGGGMAFAGPLGGRTGQGEITASIRNDFFQIFSLGSERKKKIFYPCFPIPPTSKAGKDFLSLYTLSCSCYCYHKLDTHKAPESQAAGEGEARKFILRNFSLSCLLPVPSADKAAGGIYVSEGSLPLMHSPGQRGQQGEGRNKGGAFPN